MSTVYDPMKSVISLHGLGFIQVQLPGNQRLHVWHPDLPRRSCFEHSSIHDHRFDFHSTVLVGTQINVDYVALHPGYTDGEPMTHTLYLHEGPRSPRGGRPWTPDGQVRMVEIDRKEIDAGEFYRVAAYEYHRTEPGGDGKVATLMQKTQEWPTGARSSCAIGIVPDTDFDRFQLSPAQLWAYVLEVLGAPTHIHKRLVDVSGLMADKMDCITYDMLKLAQQTLEQAIEENRRLKNERGDFNLESIAEQSAEKSGWWDSCSGCYETEGGQPVGTYTYSNTLACSLGSGCSECGGLGAVWHRAEDWLPKKEEEEELDRGCPTPEERTVTIPGCEQHEGLYSLIVTLPWACLHCGVPRGEPFDSLSFDGSRRLNVHSWVNPCGHVETYAEVRASLPGLPAGRPSEAEDVQP